MKKLFRYLSYLLCAVLWVSCSDDDMPSIDTGEYIDAYAGDMCEFTLDRETQGFDIDSAVIYMLASDTIMISRDCTHLRDSNTSIFNLKVGLKDGEYRLLYLEYTIVDTAEHKKQYGLGSRISVENGIAHVIDLFDETLQMAGTGTADDPFVVTCGPHLYNLTIEATKFSTFEKYAGAHFKQYADISLKDASSLCDLTYGWTPICNDPNYPFTGVYDGGGHTIIGMSCLREMSYGVGLFGYLNNASIGNLNVANSTIKGNHAVGAIAGYIMSRSGEQDTSAILNCSVRNCTISGSEGSVSVGGILGAIDMYTVGMIAGCTSSGNTIEAHYNVGGIVGGASLGSVTFIDLCENSSSVSSLYAGCGGIIGVADTISVTTSVNSGSVSGATLYNGAEETMGRGVGGICGGSGISYFSACRNTARVSGYEGVGGILGSARLSGGADESLLYNSTLLRYCENTGAVEARASYAGGLCGEAQLGCFGSINKGSVDGVDHVAGIVGNTGVAVIHNTLNGGSVEGNSHVAGVAGQSSMGIYALCQNYGPVSAASTHAGGIVGLTGNNTLFHYCSNHITVSGAKSPVGGIVAEIGDPREWSVMNYVECVFGAAEIVASLIGPAFAIIEHFAEGTKVVLGITEFVTESIMKATSIALLSHSIHTLAHGHLIETLTVELEASMTAEVQSIMADINAYRKSSAYTLPADFSNETIQNFASSMVDLSDKISVESAENKAFNEKLNETMNERAERIEELNHNKEVLFQIVGTITLITTTACAIASAALTGGASVALLLAGAFVGVVGGINSISKGASDFTDNVIILSQCVNTGNISCDDISDGAVGGLAGIIYDRGWIHDCLNTGNGPGEGGAFVGEYGKEHNITNCLSIANSSTWNGLIDNNSVSISEETGLYYYSTGASDDDGTPLSLDEISKSSSYDGWSFGSTELWLIPTISSGSTFPIPYTSEMTK